MLALPTALFNGQNPLGMSNAGAMKQLRGPKHENWPVCDPRAAPPGDYGLKSGENGRLARANGAIDGPYCSPTWPSVFGRRCEPLAGRGGGFGGWSCTSAHKRRVGRFFQSIRVPKKHARCPGRAALCRKAWPRWLSYVRCSREGQEEKSRCFSHITQQPREQRGALKEMPPPCPPNKDGRIRPASCFMHLYRLDLTRSCCPQHGQPAGKMGGAMWLWALGQQTERIKTLRPSLLLNPRLYCYYKH
jgi:hypothetical protein